MVKRLGYNKLPYVLIFIVLLTVTGCSEKETNTNEEYVGLLSNDEDSYALYIVAKPKDGITFELLEENEINNVKTFTQETSLESARLKVKEIPTFMVFDTEDKVYETNNRQELLKYLKES